MDSGTPENPRKDPPYSLAGFAKWCPTLILEGNKSFKLEPFQRTILKDYFAGVQETLVMLPKKNGKSTLFAALAIFHLLYTEDAECIIAASSRDQARILFKQAAKLIKRSGLEQPKGKNPVEGCLEVKSGYGMIWPAGGDRDGATIKVISADANTGDGAIPTLALVDELHRHPTGELYGVLRDGLGPRDGQIITLSTAGASMETPLGRIREAAHKLESYERDEAKKYARSEAPEGNFVMHEWCLDPEDDVEDMKVVKLANPASWHTLKKLEWRRTSPTATPSPWHWLRFACGIWTEGEEPWLEPAEWDRLSDSTAVIDAGASVWLGVSIGASQARTDIIILERDEDRVTVNLRAIMPGPNQERVSLADSESAIRALASRYSLLGVVYISLGFQHPAEVLEEEGVPMIEYPMKPARVEIMSQTLEAVVMEGRLAHDNDSALRAQVLAGVKKSTEGGWRFIVDMKGASALLALAAVCQLALNEEPVEDMGVVFI